MRYYVLLFGKPVEATYIPCHCEAPQASRAWFVQNMESRERKPHMAPHTQTAHRSDAGSALLHGYKQMTSSAQLPLGRVSGLRSSPRPRTRARPETRPSGNWALE